MKYKIAIIILLSSAFLFSCTKQDLTDNQSSDPTNQQVIDKQTSKLDSSKAESKLSLQIKDSVKKPLSLTGSLEKAAALSAARAPDEVKQIMSKALKKLKESEVMKSALKKGDTAPSFTLNDIKKGSVNSADLLAKGNLIIVFYRGGWCPYCNLQLNDLQKNLDAVTATNTQLVAISPDKPDATAKTIKDKGLNFYVLSDHNGEVGKKFGLMYKLGDDLKALYKKFGIDLKKVQDNDKWELPLSATYIVKKNGEIVYSFVDADYKKRPETFDLIKIVQNL